jgi:hypothetical protein
MKGSKVLPFPARVVDPFDPEYLKLDCGKRKQADRLHGRKARFALGPIEYPLIKACREAHPDALGLLLVIRGQGATFGQPVSVTDKLGRAIGLGRRSRRCALDALEGAGLVEVERKPCRAPRARELLRRWREQ